jgi:antitoxin component of MazEF toxin-antitoxin module
VGTPRSSQSNQELELNPSRKHATTVKPPKKKPSLEQLLAKVTPRNLHAEVDWGKPKGKEVW